MVAFNFLLVLHARTLEIQAPLDINNFALREYQHGFVCTKLQLNRPLTNCNEPRRNALTTVFLKGDRIASMFLDDFRKAGMEGI